MEYKEFEKMFLVELEKNNVKCKCDIKKFFEYMKMILQWNEKVNLTAIKDEKEFLIKHFIDSLTINKYISSNMKIIDIGTGAGFPGLPLKLSNEDAVVTLIDSVGKKINVLNDIISKLNLNDIYAIHSRAEDYAKDNREQFDVAVSRAVANMSTLVEYLIPFVKIGGIIICMKGPNFEKELENSKKAINILGGKIEKVESFYIDEEFERNIIIIRKIKETPKQYPRGQAKPLKNPIN